MKPEQESPPIEYLERKKGFEPEPLVGHLNPNAKPVTAQQMKYIRMQARRI